MENQELAKVDTRTTDLCGPFMDNTRLWDAVYVALITSPAAHGEAYESYCHTAAEWATTAVTVRGKYLRRFE